MLFSKAKISALHNLGIEFFKRGDAKQAEVCFRRALDLAIQIGDLYEQGKSLINLGEALREAGRLDDAAICFERALESEVTRDALDAQAKTYWHLATLKREQGDLSAADDARKRSIDLHLQHIRSRKEEDEDIYSIHRIVRDGIMHDDTSEAENALESKLLEPNVSAHHRVLANKLREILRGSRNVSLIDDPALPYFEVAELKFLLEFLDKHESKRGIYMLQFKSFVLSHLGAIVAGKEPRFNFHKWDQWIKDEIVTPLLESFPEDKTRVLSNINVAILSTDEASAKAQLLDPTGAEPVVLVDFVLISYIRDLLVLLLDFGRADSSEEHELIRRIEEIGRFYSSPRGAPWPDFLRRLDAKRFEDLLDLLLVGATGFIICHEYGHILLEHFTGKPDWDGTYADKSCAVLNREIQADATALELVLPWLVAREEKIFEKSANQLSPAIPLIVLSSMAFLQTFRGYAGHYGSARARAEQLRTILEPKLAEDALNFARSFEIVFELACSQREE